MLNIIGDSGQPCRTPCPISQQPDNSLFILITAFVPSITLQSGFCLSDSLQYLSASTSSYATVMRYKFTFDIWQTCEQWTCFVCDAVQSRSRSCLQCPQHEADTQQRSRCPSLSHPTRIWWRRRLTGWRMAATGAHQFHTDAPAELQHPPSSRRRLSNCL